MHDTVERYLATWATEQLAAAETVLDLGGMNVNGNARKHWPDAEITGLDMRDGPDVDIVCHSWDMPFADEHFDVVVCTEMLEHDEHPERTFPEVARVLGLGGTLILTCRGPGFPYHEEPGDWWRFTPADIEAWMSWAFIVPIESKADPGVPGVLAAGIKLAPSTTPTLAPPALTPVVR